MPILRRRPRRRLAVVAKAIALLVVVGAIAALAMKAFDWGFSAGMSAAGGLVIVYTIPAAVFGWPHVSLSDVLEFLLFVWESIVSFFVSLFE